MTATLTTLLILGNTNPNGGLLADANGDLFGTTSDLGPNGHGTVFELVNDGGTYTLTTLLSFFAPPSTAATGPLPVAA